MWGIKMKPEELIKRVAELEDEIAEEEKNEPYPSEKMKRLRKECEDLCGVFPGQLATIEGLVTMVCRVTERISRR